MLVGDFAMAGAGGWVGRHRHPVPQLAWARSGVLMVRALGRTWVLPATTALWIPPGVRHATGTAGTTEARALYVPQARPAPPAAPRPSRTRPPAPRRPRGGRVREPVGTDAAPATERTAWAPQPMAWDYAPVAERAARAAPEPAAGHAPATGRVTRAADGTAANPARAGAANPAPAAERGLRAREPAADPAPVPHPPTRPPEATDPAPAPALTSAPAPVAVGWTEPTVVAVTPLLRALFDHLADDAPAPPARARAEAVLLDQLAPVAPTSVLAPMPRDPRSRAVAEALRDTPADARTLAEWSPYAGAAPRTLARLFVAETGMPFGRWRTHLRLQESLPLLASGATVATAARHVGYASPSAFVAAFHRTVGAPPGTYFPRD
ncbi:AraC family transcriptional regulator [Streptomyces sp. 184]|uniref:AraC family transcriptional regulator n=1 Tax=Streptomyces sp. 184 TaxID=1827526 RepID=UPI0038916A59